MRIKRRIFSTAALVLCCAFTLASCGEEAGTASQTGSGDAAQGETTVLKVEDYGAVGDGVTDCSEAFEDVLKAAREYQEKGPVVIRFEKDASYYAERMVGKKIMFYIDDYKNLTLQGDNTTLIMNRDRIDTYVHIERSENVRMDGFNLKTSVPIYSLSDVLAINHDELTIDIQTDISLGIEETFYSSITNSFGLPLTDDYRGHLYIDTIDVLDAGANKYRVNLKDMDNVRHKLQTLEEKQYRFIVPMPYHGQENGEAFIVTNSTNVDLRNINLWSSSNFGFHLRYNRETFNITNVNITPEPGTDGALSSWRDGFHMKENLCQFVFDGCRFEKLQDDVFNFGVTDLTIDKIYSDTEFNMFCEEFNGTFYMDFEPGQILTVYDDKDGSYIARTRIKECVERNGATNRIIVEDPLPGLKEGFTVGIDSHGQPNSIVRNCYIDGSYRLRTPVTFENCEMHTLFGWIDNMPQSMEGPIPYSVHFKNCRFDWTQAAADPSDRTFYSDYMMRIGVETTSGRMASFAVKDITFEDCDIDTGLIQFLPGTAEVIFSKNGEVYLSTAGQ